MSLNRDFSVHYQTPKRSTGINRSDQWKTGQIGKNYLKIAKDLLLECPFYY